MRYLGLVQRMLAEAGVPVGAEIYLLYAREEGASGWALLEPRLEENPELRHVLWRAPTLAPGALIDLALEGEAAPSGHGREVVQAVPVVEVLDLRGPHGLAGAQWVLRAGLPLRVPPAGPILLWLTDERVVGPVSLRLQNGRWFLPEGMVLETRLSPLQEVGAIAEVSVDGLPRLVLVPRAAPSQPQREVSVQDVLQTPPAPREQETPAEPVRPSTPAASASAPNVQPPAALAIPTEQPAAAPLPGAVPPAPTGPAPRPPAVSVSPSPTLAQRSTSRPERLGRWELPASLVALHARLDEHYRALAEGSAERRVFVLEHRLDEGQLRELFAEVSTALSQQGPDASAWLLSPLPLLVAAAEVGYDYRGTGTDFWPRLRERLGYDFGYEDRIALTRLFGAFAERYRGSHPADTPWSRAFCHIAWPVHHAVLPLEFHRPLMRALAGLTVRVRPTTRSDEVVRELQRWAASHGSRRFQGWLYDTELAADIAREMLGMPQEEGRRLEPALLARLHRDLEQDEAARRELDVALARQEELGRRAPSATPPQRLSLRLLRTEEGGPRLLLAMPGLTGSRADEVRVALRRLRFMPRPWGLGSPLHSDSLFTPGLVPLRLERLPEPGVPLLPGLESLTVKGAQELLGQLTVDLTPPLVFRVSNEGEQASQQEGRGLRLGQRYWLLVEDSEAEALRAAGATEVGPVAGLLCLEVEARGAVLRWLEAHGFTASERPKVAWEGAPSVSPYAERPLFAEGDCVALRLTRVPVGGARVEVKGAKGSESLQLEAEGLVLVEAVSGEVRATVEAGGERQERSARLGVAPPPAVSPIRLGLEPAGATLQDLLRRRCVLRVDSLVSLEARSLTASLSWEGRVRTWAELRPLEVPVALGSDSPLWEQLLPQHLLERVARQERLTLRVSLGALATEEWSLEQEVAHLWWEEQEGGLPRAVTEAGPVALQVVPAADPLAEPVPLEGQEPLPQGVSLLFPLPVEGQPVFTGRCVGPAQLRLGDEQPRRPERLLRQVEGQGREQVGARRVVEAYLHWSLAVAPPLPLELRRRGTVASLERWSVEQLCGETWALEEHTALERAVGDPWAALVEVCRERRLGFGHVPLGPADEAWFRAWLRRSSRELLGTLPEGEELTPELVERLDLLLSAGLVALLAQAEAAGRTLEFKREDIDVGNGDEDWREALSEARRRVELPSLRALLYPAEEAEHLLRLDYVSTELEALVEELTSWVRRTQGLLGTPRWAREEVHALLALWTAPHAAVRLEWPRALARGLADRATARALRYVALRARLAQQALGKLKQQGEHA